ncbi:hypothetical protein ACTXT7_004901 [Hymenolepis weldensis]
MEARISTLMRNTFTQTKFSTLTIDPKDYVKNAGETFATWYTKYRDIYENIMADLPHATRITMLLREFNRNDHYPLLFSKKQFIHYACKHLAQQQGA